MVSDKGFSFLGGVNDLFDAPFFPHPNRYINKINRVTNVSFTATTLSTQYQIASSWLPKSGEGRRAVEINAAVAARQGGIVPRGETRPKIAYVTAGLIFRLPQ